MKFTNRKQEMARLDRLVKRKEAAVAVVWGRRRVGKTRLLLEWTQKHKGVYYTADESSVAIQRSYFALAIAGMLPGFADVEYPDWAALFSRLTRDAVQAKWRGPIVIDELPYLISVSPELPSVLQKFIDREFKSAKLILVFCGSSQRMMQGAILDASAPLYGRAQEVMKLGPISAGYMQGALKLKTAREVVESYAIWGGIPRYWELAQTTRGTFLAKIDKIVLDPMGPLNDEPDRLLLEELPPAIHLRPILDAIGMGSHRLSEVAARIGQPVTSLMRPVQRLLELDLIQREIPYGIDANNTKRTLYKIKDPFVRFWFAVVAPRRSLFSQTTAAVRLGWLKKILPSLFSMMWEELCRFAVPLMHLDGKNFGEAGRFWHGDGPEWDILSLSEDRKILLVGEAKWTVKTPSTRWINRAVEEMMQRGSPPVERHLDTQMLYVLFVPDRPKGLTLPKGVKIITAREILRFL